MEWKQNKFIFSAISLLFAAMLACSSFPSLVGTPTLTATSSPAPTLTPEPSATPLTPIDIKVVSSLPMFGASRPDVISIINAEKLRLEQANYLACDGKYKISYEAWDDSNSALGTWDPGAETKNAVNAASDNSIIAYLGTFNSGAAKFSIPILNKAGPMVMISPANTYPGLTKQVPGIPQEPEIYYPTGIRNYARVVTADDVQGNLDARYIKNKLGLNTVYILDDNQLYGIIVADSFEREAKEIGLILLGHKSIDPKAKNYQTLMAGIAKSNDGKPPDAIFASMVYDNNAPQVLIDKVKVMGDNNKVKFFGPDGIQTQDLIYGAGATISEGVYASVAGVPFDSYTAAGQKFIQDYGASYGTLNEPYAIYGYEAMNVLLKAIENVCSSGGDVTDRETVRAAVFDIKEFQGVLGTWSFDANGDTTLTDMTIYQVQNGQYVSVGTYK